MLRPGSQEKPSFWMSLCIKHARMSPGEILFQRHSQNLTILHQAVTGLSKPENRTHVRIQRVLLDISATIPGHGMVPPKWSLMDLSPAPAREPQFLHHLMDCSIQVFLLDCRRECVRDNSWESTSDHKAVNLLANGLTCKYVGVGESLYRLCSVGQLYQVGSWCQRKHAPWWTGEPEVEKK